MTRRTLLGLAALVAAGCAKSEEAATAGESPLPKAPNATAAQNAENLKKANMPDGAKKILGGGAPGSN